jgi:hypothetical protein
MSLGFIWIQHLNLSIYLYYKERRQLKTFLTKFGPALPLTSDLPVRLYDDQKVERPEKSQFGEHFCQKRIIFLAHAHPTRQAYPPLGPPACLRLCRRAAILRLLPRRFSQAGSSSPSQPKYESSSSSLSSAPPLCSSAPPLGLRPIHCTSVPSRPDASSLAQRMMSLR